MEEKILKELESNADEIKETLIQMDIMTTLCIFLTAQTFNEEQIEVVFSTVRNRLKILGLERKYPEQTRRLVPLIKSVILDLQEVMKKQGIWKV